MLSHQQCLDSLMAYDMQFDLVAKLRPDAMWPQSVLPYCYYNPMAIYAIWPAPADWFFILPRVAAPLVLGLYDKYQKCGPANDMNSMDCCAQGGGITGQVLCEFSRSGLPVIGPPYDDPESRPRCPHQVPGARDRWPPFAAGSYQRANLFSAYVVRTEFSHTSGMCDFLRRMPRDQMLDLFPSTSLCNQVMRPQEHRREPLPSILAEPKTKLHMQHKHNDRYGDDAIGIGL